MEEIITLDGKSFKLTTDRPLTALERQQTIAQIRQQTGCSSCHQPRTMSTGGVYSLPYSTDVTGLGTTGKKSTDTVTLKANPDGGVAPYYVYFWMSTDGAALTQLGVGAQSVTIDTYTASTTHVLTDADVAASDGNLNAKAPASVNTTNGVITLGSDPATLDMGSIRFYTSIVDSCPNTGDMGTCAQYADVGLACVAPTCNFVVT